MKKQHVCGLSLVGLFLIFVFLVSVVSMFGQSKRLCCVSGNYQGFQVTYEKPRCPKPEKEPFTMVILQGDDCSAKVWGTVTDAEGLVSRWEGTLTLGLRGCCTIEGVLGTPHGNRVEFKGSLCLRKKTWHGQGTWREIPSPDPCRDSGTWEMSRI